jgi:hypothetical protein
MMLSPVHVCFLVTKDFFKANLLSSYPYIIKSALLVLGLALAVYSTIIVF